MRDHLLRVVTPKPQIPFPHTTPDPDIIVVISLPEAHIGPKRSLVARPSSGQCPATLYQCLRQSPNILGGAQIRGRGTSDVGSLLDPVPNLPSSGDCFSSTAHTTVPPAQHRPLFQIATPFVARP